MAALACAYLPRRPTETVLYGLVRQHLESFLAHAREHYEAGVPRYVENELRAYLRCGVFSEGFTRPRCDACGHDLLVAFSCKSRTVCPSCCGRRMANTAATPVDRVLPDVPVRQYVLSLPYELRRLAAYRADVLTALGGAFVEAIFAGYRGRAKRDGVAGAQCGAVTFVHRAGSLNLNVHFHVAVLDGVFSRDPQVGVIFQPARPPTAADLDAIVRRTQRRVTAWLRRHGYLDERADEDRSNEPPAQTAIDACAAIAMGRGRVAILSRADEVDAVAGDARPPDGLAVAVARDGYDLHAGVRIEAGDDLGREKLCRYGARPPVSLERLRRLPGGRIAYRLKYVGRGRGKHRVMTAMDFMARLAAIICPPRYPLVRYSGVLAPRSAWRREVVPRPRELPTCSVERPAPGAGASPVTPKRATTGSRSVARPRQIEHTSLVPPLARADRATPAPSVVAHAYATADPRGAVALAPNVLAVRHWDRLLGGVLYAASTRVDWASLLRRSFDVDVLACPKCHGRLRVLAVITGRAPVQRILAHLGLPTEPPPLARARDPTDEEDDAEPECQLELTLG